MRWTGSQVSSCVKVQLSEVPPQSQGNGRTSEFQSSLQQGASNRPYVATCESRPLPWSGFNRTAGSASSSPQLCASHYLPWPPDPSAPAAFHVLVHVSTVGELHEGTKFSELFPYPVSDGGCVDPSMSTKETSKTELFGSTATAVPAWSPAPEGGVAPTNVEQEPNPKSRNLQSVAERG